MRGFRIGGGRDVRTERAYSSRNSMRQGSTTDSGAGRTEPGDWLSRICRSRRRTAWALISSTGKRATLIRGGGQAEKRVFVHAGKPQTAVADVDAPVVEIAQGLGGEDMRGEEKAVGVGNHGENAVERIADVLPVAGIGDLSVEAGIGVQSRFRQRAEVAPVPQFHCREVGEGRDDGDFAESPGGKMTDQRMAARLVVDHHAAGVRFREAAVEQHDRAAALRKAADLASRSVGRGDDDAVDLFRPEKPYQGVFPFGFGVRAGDHQRVAFPLGFRLDPVGDVGEEGVRNRGEDQPDGFRYARVEASGQQVRFVCQGAGAGEHAALCLRADPFFVALPREDPRNGRFREVELAGYVLE